MLLKSSSFDLPWNVHGGRGLFGLPPIQGALVTWAALMTFVLLFVVSAALISRRQWRQLNIADAREAAMLALQVRSPAERARLRADAGELLRQAAATAAAAKRAEFAVIETRERCDLAQESREVAWQAFDVAQRAYEVAARKAAAHGAEPPMLLLRAVAPTDPASKHPDPASDVSRAAMAAYRRGDITVEQLGAVFRQASGWDPLRELQAREVELRRSAESRARRLYQAAAAAERSAVKAADVATVVAVALTQESFEVAAEARAVRDELNAAFRAGFVPAQRAPKRAGRAAVVPRQRTARQLVGR